MRKPGLVAGWPSGGDFNGGGSMRMKRGLN